MVNKITAPCSNAEIVTRLNLITDTSCNMSLYSLFIVYFIFFWYMFLFKHSFPAPLLLETLSLVYTYRRSAYSRELGYCVSRDLFVELKIFSRLSLVCVPTSLRFD